MNTEDYLAHYGVKGMKWGVRRYQNKDGSLTEAGKNRYYTRYGASSVGGEHAKETTDYRPFAAIGTGVAGATASVAIAAVTDGIVNPFLALMSLASIGGGSAALIKKGYRDAKRNTYEKERKEAKLDPKSGLKKKSKILTEKEDLVRVNNDFYDFKSGSKNNCTICSVAFELRRRGFEVRAKRSAIGFKNTEINAWFNGKLKYETYVNPLNYKEQIRKSILSQGENARGSLNIGFGVRDGHAITYMVKNGKIKVLDAQSAKEYTLDKILERAHYCEFARWDNVPINYSEVRKVVE